MSIKIPATIIQAFDEVNREYDQRDPETRQEVFNYMIQNATGIMNTKGQQYSRSSLITFARSYLKQHGYQAIR